MLAPADVPYATDECDGELTFVDYSKEGQAQTARPKHRPRRNPGGNFGTETHKHAEYMQNGEPSVCVSRHYIETLKLRL